MNLTDKEKEICKQYSAYDKDGYVHCYDCPLVIDKWSQLCKSNATEEEWEEELNDTTRFRNAEMLL